LNDLKHGEFFGGRARLVPLAVRAESRGSLIPFDFETLPFIPRHAFIVRDVPAGTIRGRHAHGNALQLLVCLAGVVNVELRNSGESVTVVLDRPEIGLLIGAGLWASQTYLSSHTVLLVFASQPYDPGAVLTGDEPEPHR
jgi:hypothetical protein